MPYPFTARLIITGFVATFFTLLFFVAPLNAQRSLYEEAMFVTEYERNREEKKNAFQIEISVQNDSTRLTIDGDSIELESGGKYTHSFSAFGYASVLLRNASSGDKVVFSVYDTTLQYVIPDQGLYSFYVGQYPGSDESGLNATGRIEMDALAKSVFSEQELCRKVIDLKPDEKYTSIFSNPLLFQLLKFNKLSGNQLSEELNRGYRTHPLFKDRFSDLSTLDKLEYDYDEYTLIKDQPENFLTSYYTHYPYQRFISRDSILDLRRQLSVDVSGGSYRKQIVTAQQELREASKDINEQRVQSGAFSAQKVAVGLSDFIAERAQEELNLTFFNRFKEKLGEDSELTKLFPATRDLMFKFELTNYKTFLAHARETFQNDLDNLGLHLPGILELKKYQALQNDPNVFNLSLIFSIAELAYREQPVENILLASLQRLQYRKENLELSINQAIADSVFRRRDEGGNLDPLMTYRTSVVDYLSLVDSLKYCLTTSADSLKQLLNTKARQYRAGQSTAATLKVLRYYGKEYAVETVIDELSRIRFSVENTSVNSIGESSDYFSAKFRGNDYHLYRQNPASLKPNDYEAYYSQTPIPPKENLVQAIDVSGDLLQRDYIAAFKRSNDRINSVFDSLIFWQANDLKNEEITPEIIQEKLQKCSDKYFALQIAFIDELNFWEDVTGLGAENHYIGGLRFLSEAYLVDLENVLPGISVLNYDGIIADASLRTGNVVVSTSFYYNDSMKVDEINKQIQPVYDVANEYHQKLLAQRDRMLAAFGDRVALIDSVQLKFLTKDKSLIETGNPSRLTIRDLYGKLDMKFLRQFEAVEEARAEEQLQLDGKNEQFAQDFLVPQDQMLERLGSLRQGLLTMRTDLEKEHAASLIAARQNANQLATTFEVATHLLYAFRNYDRSYDTLYYQDTQRVEITVQLPPDANGLVSTYTKDSLAIFQRIVPGTTEKVNARWISREEFRALRKDDLAWKNFVGLLYQRLKTVEGLPEVEVGALAGMAVRFFEIANEMEEQRNNFRRKWAADERSITFKDYYPFIRSTVDLFNTVISLDFGTQDGQLFQDLVLVPYISNEALSLYENIFVKDYGNAVLNATELMKVIVGQVPEKFKAQLQDNTQLDLTKALRREQTDNQRGINAVFRYGSFMASMINAETSDQIKTILQSTTLPPGSSRVKREVLSSFTINSYLGAGLGRDRLLDAPSDLNADAFGAALSVPIGLTYSFSPAFLRNRSSFSIHVPLLDLGAITAYRSNPSGNTANVDNLPELEWKNLFSPGAYFIYNFADSPFSLGVGGQYGPQLREIVPENGDPLFLNSWRFPMAIFTIDVPFYSLHTGPRKVVVR